MQKAAPGSPSPLRPIALLGLGLAFGPGCTIITGDAYDFRMGDSGITNQDGGADGGTADGGAGDGGSGDCDDPLTWYADDDGDGFGNPLDLIESCDQPDGYVDNADDCDDSDPDIGDSITFFQDSDDDGYGSDDVTAEACDPPSGFTDRGGDCLDDDPDVNPGQTETCATDADDDCSGSNNQQDAADCTQFYFDLDGDGYGDNAGDLQCWCAPQGDYTGSALGDCDPAEPLVNPGQEEDCFDGVDNNCDGLGCRMDGVWTAEDADGVYDGAAGGQAAELVRFIGDLDGDGSDDLGIGAPQYGTGGAVFVVTGPDLGSIALASDASLRVLGAGSSDVAGRALGGLPDLSGDGYDELLVGAPSSNDAATDAGAVYLFYGPASGELSTSDADLTFSGAEAYHYAGRSLVGVDDATGDGVPDLLVGATGDDTGGNNSGAAYLLAGPFEAGALDAVAVTVFTGSSNGDTAARQLDRAGDVDGDGLEDFVIGAHLNDDGGNGAGAAYLVLGGELGTVSVDDAQAILVGEAAGDNAGKAVAPAGDVNGDGAPDLLVGAPGRSSDAGAAYVALGPITGTVSLADAWELSGEAGDDLAGTSVSSGGDLDGDGSSEILVGAPGSDRAADGGGAVYLIYGSPGGSLSLADSEVVFEGSDGAAGTSVAGGGDHDADGTTDLLFGSSGFNADDGRAYLFRGEGL